MKAKNIDGEHFDWFWDEGNKNQIKTYKKGKLKKYFRKKWLKKFYPKKDVTIDDI